jgi:hypothetical protein
MTSIRNWSFILLWLFIIRVSAHDGFLVLANRTTIAADELNPLGKLLIAASSGDIWLLLAAKAGGTLCAAWLMLVLYWERPRIGWLACAITAGLQLALLLFLYFSRGLSA